MRTTVILVLACLGLFYTQLAARNNQAAPGNTPNWVKPVTINYTNQQLEQQAEDGYFDIATIKQVNLPQQSTYMRRVLKVLNESGIENISEVSVTFDPAYQKLTFSDIHITRNGKNINKLKGARFRHLQMETEAYLHQYDGRTTTLLVLDDVRVGDIIEYAYTIQGFNPVFGGKYADYFYGAYSVPLGQIYYRVVCNSNSRLYIENTNTNIEPHEQTTGALKEYEWLFANVPALHPNDQLPAWYEAFPLVMVSEYNDWLNIREWAAKLFPPTVAVGKPLQQKIADITTSYTIPQARAAAALRFVQDEVRYVGIEMGTGTHQPANPNTTFTRRYGDCKDKSYLLVTMLQQMGIAATPVLVNSSLRQSVARLTPSPKAFDHVVVRFTINGQQYFVDATINNQRGPIESISFPPYQMGLVLGDSTSGLSALNAPEKGMIRVREVFDVPGFDDNATLHVTTVNSGTFADDARSLFKNNSSYEIQKQYRDFYAAHFEKIKSDSIYYEDDEATGTFTVHELYTLPGFWKDEKGIKKTNLYAFCINSYLRRPKDVVRTMPLAYHYPAKYLEEIEVNLPADWSVANYDRVVKSAVFTYTGKSTLGGRKLTMVYTFETVRDHVMPAEMDDLLAAYQKINDSMGWELTYNTGGGGASLEAKTTNTLSATTQRNIKVRLSIFLMLIIGAFAFAAWRQRQGRRNSQ